MKSDIDSNLTKRLKNNFSKQERLDNKDITTLFKNCRKLKKEDYLGIYRKNCLPYSRLAVSVKRKSGKAVYRNYEKRIVKEVFRTNKDKLPNIDILIIKLSNRRVAFQSKKQDIVKLFMQINKTKFNDWTC